MKRSGKNSLKRKEDKLDFNAHVHSWDIDDPSFTKPIKRILKPIVQSGKVRNSSIGPGDILDREIMQSFPYNKMV